MTATAEQPRYFATTRQVTGLPFQFYAYVYDRQTGRPVSTCSHVHVRRGGVSGNVFALRCAEKQLRHLVSRAKPATSTDVAEEVSA